MRILDRPINDNTTGWVWPVCQASIRIYRRNLLVLLATSVLWLVPLSLARDSSEQMTQLLVVYGEVVLAAVLASMSLGILLNDPYREVLLTIPIWVGYLIIARLFVLIGAGIMALAFTIGAGYALHQHLTLNIGQIFLGSSVSIITFASLGLCLSLCLGNITGGGICIATIWTCALLFQGIALNVSAIRFFYPFMTLYAPSDPFWFTNRFCLTLLALTAAVVSVRLASNEERIIGSEIASEDI